MSSSKFFIRHEALHASKFNDFQLIRSAALELLSDSIIPIRKREFNFVEREHVRIFLALDTERKRLNGSLCEAEYQLTQVMVVWLDLSMKSEREFDHVLL
jgi:hypothetical protein